MRLEKRGKFIMFIL
ncbi:hypothetical protein OCT59_008027 [Rhizophagus irregularis]|nr:hypothetical protein OCT59_008027 [Rhizophagus irregularis]